MGFGPRRDDKIVLTHNHGRCIGFKLFVGKERIVTDSATTSQSLIHPGFARWVDTIPSKRLEMLGKTRIPTFTRCPATLSPVRISQAVEIKGKSTSGSRKRQCHPVNPGSVDWVSLTCLSASCC